MTATAPTTAPAPTATARELGLAHHAARGVLENVLARYGATFPQQIALRAAITADTPQAPDDLVARVHDSLKADPAGIRAVLDELRAKGLLVAEGAHLRPTDAGRALFAAVAAETAPISARIWGGIPAEDLAAAGRVLALVTERADAELAALTA
ncbi:MarR family transcriptional regulator [Streptomyces sp. ISL-111]|uniref:MarR family transcriptional regulator n=1 Tax=unclassified Streptomyces TaxID=2593676 RepID=UPI001BECABD1|nr:MULTISPECIES: MarR family transcriptional regulator [unclassified Streptomyces]MBT2378655.1 MarR family transcriptional regulator [Streptomyces sp. ISL-111]MBT2427833.1 MarR family transcriptional regulator [Streptomyces sp. ISL-112]MBT2464656.1 MarR family transcriptional regulator [Streptomyces sp. ISL-63]